MRDTTERKRWEEALQESEDKFKAIFEHANDEIIYLDKYGTNVPLIICQKKGDAFASPFSILVSY
jgi:PAS domain-containing protein